MTDRPRLPASLAELAREPTRVGELRPEDAGRLLAELAGLALAVAARLAEPEPVPPPQPLPLPREQPGVVEGDRLLTAEEVALRLGLDVAAVTRRRFPFRVKLGRRTVRYSEAGLSRWMKAGGR